MNNKICPYLDRPCIQDDCMAWNDNKCIVFTPMKFSLGSDDTSVEMPDQLKTMNVDELAITLVNFIKSKGLDYDQWSTIQDYLQETFSISEHELSSEIDQKLRRALDNTKELLIPELLVQKSITEIVSLIIDWLSQSDRDLDDYENFDSFWREHNFTTRREFQLPEKYRTKLHSVRNDYWDRIKELKKEEKKRLQSEEKRLVFAEIPRMIKWLKTKNLKKMSKSNLKVFLNEIGMKVSPTNRQAVYLEINQQLSE